MANRRNLPMFAALAGLAGLFVAQCLPGHCEELTTTNRRLERLTAADQRIFKPLDEIRIEARLERDVLPVDRAADLFAPATRASDRSLRRADWDESIYWWVPPEFFYRPLYFDDVPLERYGESAFPRLQPAVSGARFLGDFMLLPYKWTADTPWRWVSPLGYERPGGVPPFLRQRVIPPHGSQPRWDANYRPVLIGQDP